MLKQGFSITRLIKLAAGFRCTMSGSMRNGPTATHPCILQTLTTAGVPWLLQLFVHGPTSCTGTALFVKLLGGVADSAGATLS